MPAPPRWPEASACVEGVVVDQRAAGGVDKVGARLHGGELGRAHHAGGLRRHAGVQADDVGLAQQFFKADRLDAQLGEAGGGDEGVVGDHAQAKGLEIGHEQLRHGAEADQADGLAAQLAAGAVVAIEVAQPDALG